jgi:hypothetical protein
MNLKKNLAAKVGAAVAGIAALLGTWALVHTNPPPPAAADAPAAAAAASATPARGKRVAAAAVAPVTRKRHTRTHVS